jgi:FkbM family methyltransferase
MASHPEPSTEKAEQVGSGPAIRRTVKVRGTFDVTFVIDARLEDPIGRVIAESGQYPVGDPTELMMHLLRPDDALLDVGAHIGTFTLPAAALGCRVLALEASARNAELLQAAAACNGFDRVRVVHAAASDCEGRLSFCSHGPHGHVAMAVEPAHLPRGDVRAAAVDDLVAEQGWPRVDFIKMDVEGWEPWALRGMARLLARDDAPLVLFESNAAGLERYGQTTADLQAALEQFGYSIYLIDHHHPGQLVPVRSSDVQPECVLDCLAAKRLPARLDPWRVVPLTRAQWTAWVLGASTDPHPPYRRHFAVAMRTAPPWLRAEPAVREALKRMRSDPDHSVRNAACSVLVSARTPAGVGVGAGPAPGTQGPARAGLNASRPAGRPEDPGFSRPHGQKNGSMNVLHVSTWNEPCGIAGYAADLVDALDQLGVHNAIHRLHQQDRPSPLPDEVRDDLDAICVRAREYDVVHVQHEFSFFNDSTFEMASSIEHFGHLLAGLQRAGTPVVVTFHTEPHFLRSIYGVVGRLTGLRQRLQSYQCGRAWRHRVGRFFQAGSRFLGITHTYKGRARLIETGFHRTCVRRLPIGVPARVGRGLALNREWAKQELGYAPDTILLSAFGFISSYKGHDLAVAALRLLPRHYHLAIVGGPHPRAFADPTMDDLLKTLRRHRSLRSRVRITNYVPQETIELYQAATDVCLAPYRGFNLSASAGLTWALASGRPVIASKVTPFVELNDQAGCLLLFTENAEHELAWQIERLVADDGLSEQLVQRALAYAEQNSWANVGGEVLAAYQALRGNKPATSATVSLAGSPPTRCVA